MAIGDVTISIAVEGGVTKTVVLDSDTRTLALAYETARTSVPDARLDDVIETDAEWQVYFVNKFAKDIIGRANHQQEANLSYTAKTFTAAT